MVAEYWFAELVGPAEARTKMDGKPQIYAVCQPWHNGGKLDLQLLQN